MTLLLAEFSAAGPLLQAAGRARAAGWRGLDAHTPFAIEGMAEALALPPTRLRLIMLAGGLAGAAAGLGLEIFSIWDYPLRTGGRPAFAWQPLLIMPFELGVLAAATAGMIAFLWRSGLPRPYRAIFAAEGFERASQDRFFLAVQDDRFDAAALRHLLDGLDPVAVREVAA